ncbi:MAG: hypothetical protein JO307_28015 [Bryobacterales bacterium]|nr:hypothetical protein [Bryobacterales bacterium]MBV9401585.1 hypothetical protein [Bryobacterales bacterium]
MTDTQILAIAVSFAGAFLAVLTGVLLNNSRLTDIKEITQREIINAKELLRAEIKASESSTHTDIAELRTTVEKQHSELLLKISELENRRVIQ